jgi:nucleoid DNA-binding protein
MIERLTVTIHSTIMANPARKLISRKWCQTNAGVPCGECSVYLSGARLASFPANSPHGDIPKGTQMEPQETATVKKPMTKTEIVASLSKATDLTKQQVSGLFSELTNLIGRNLNEEGPGVITVPGLMKVKVVRKPATEARKGLNPFTKEETIFKAKPARNVVKILPLKGLKDMV